MITREPRDQIIAESAKIGRSSWKHTCGASEVLYPVSPPHKSARDVKPDYAHTLMYLNMYWNFCQKHMLSQEIPQKKMRK